MYNLNYLPFNQENSVTKDNAGLVGRQDVVDGRRTGQHVYKNVRFPLPEEPLRHVNALDVAKSLKDLSHLYFCCLDMNIVDEQAYRLWQYFLEKTHCIGKIKLILSYSNLVYTLLQNILAFPANYCSFKAYHLCAWRFYKLHYVISK